ncbi:calmodulin-binding protein 60 A isoform X2 [Dendrobium catenatum]|uniref:calmodulin-binding protein 60 A isoform X2 n=1 Tax=Dendrobium catenatum TaxID=906689 RepID=UPI0009F6C8E8|nr:calmodulin-binding protein 60 A isoform X2 [Dendrobium catenatum]
MAFSAFTQNFQTVVFLKLDEASARFHCYPLFHCFKRGDLDGKLSVLGCPELAGQEECDGSSAPEAKRPRLLIAAMREVMGAQFMQSHLSKLESFLRRVVQEEVQNAFNHHVHSVPRIPPATPSHSTVSKQYQLHFNNTLPHTIYTGSRIEAEGGVPVQVLIIDSGSKLIVTSGPLASAKIEILALDGDFGDEDEWSEKHFVDNIVRERDGKRPLLTGELTITLNQGVGCVNDASFTDNSSWIRSRKFRLGARACPSKLMEGRIQEAKSEAFLVKDHRGESYKKHHPPSLNDEVWRLEKIGKDGAFHKRLADKEIYTVQDFLRNLVMDQSKLRSLLGNGMSNKIWEATVEHARECVPDDKLYSYCRGQGVILIFNSIYQLIGANIDHIYHSLNELSASQKIIVNKLKELAYRNKNDIAPVHTFTKPMPPIDIALDPVASSCSEPQIPDIPGTVQDELNVHQLSMLQQSQPHVPCSGLLEDLTQLKDIFGTQRFGSFNSYSFIEREFFDHFHEGQASAIMTSEQQYGGYNSDFELMTPSLMPAMWDHGKAPCGTTDSSLGFGHVPAMSHMDTSARMGSSRWVKLIAALKWWFVLRQLASRKEVEATKMPRITEIGYPTLTTAMCTDTTWW